MNANELYEQIALHFPAVWPSTPKQRWVNVHDGNEPLIKAIEILLREHLHSGSVVVLVHSEPGVAVVLPTAAEAADYIAPHVLRHDIQAADPLYGSFVHISSSGVGTGDS